MPIRIQRKRVRGWRMPKGAVYAGRPSRWGNPHRPEDYNYGSTRQCKRAAVKAFEHDLDHGLLGISKADIVAELRDKDLVCWCPEDEPCHVDVLLRIANAGNDDA